MDVQVDLRSLNRNFVREFIQIYKDSPCLWDMKHPSYSNKMLKRKAFGKLIAKCRTVDKTANRDFVSKKIASLRSSFRKEWKKVLKLMDEAETDVFAQEQLRMPVSLWYFDLLLFTVDTKSAEKYRTYRPDDEYVQSDEEEEALIPMDSIKRKSSSKTFIRNLITVYKENPCLWLVKSRDYNDKNKKKEAYAKLIIKARETIPNADKEFISKKIACLRGAFRKEIRKTKQAHANGEEYNTSLWYFDLLKFTLNKGLDGQQIGQTDFKKGYKEEPELDLNEDYNNKVWQPGYDDTQDDGMSFDDDNSGHDYNSLNEKQEEDSDLITDPLSYVENNPKSSGSRDETVYLPSSHKPSRDCTGPSEVNATRIISTQVGRESVNSHQRTTIQQDEHDAYGVTIAAKLRKMDSVQRLYAENIINQALYKGALFALTDRSAIVDHQPNL